MPLVIKKLQNWAKDENAPGYSAENRDVACCAPRTPDRLERRVIPFGDNPPSGDRFRAPLMWTSSEILLRHSMVPGGDRASASPCVRRSGRVFSGSTGSEPYAGKLFEKLLRFGRERCSRDV